jgi:uncharacterized membrane protein YhaH (DUF805 family)
MDWVWYLFKFQGRINRAKYWLAGLIIVCWMIFLAMIATIFGVKTLHFSVEDIFRVVDPNTYRRLSSTDLRLIAVKMIGTPVFLWVYVATSIKRLHDRDKSAWWMIPFFVVPGLIDQFLNRLGNSYAMIGIGAIAAALLTWCGIELLFFKGSRKTNRFGRNPLEPPPTPDTGRRWGQQSEIEMAPHKAGPPPRWRVKPET